MTTASPKSVLLLGASRGLGLAIAEEYLTKGAQVVATVRGREHTSLHDLYGTYPERLQIEDLDITISDQVAQLHDLLTNRSFDLLFVNAGTTNAPHETPADVSTDEFSRLMITNALSPMRVIEALGDLVSPTGTIAIMSSGQGSVTNNTNGGFEIYRASKSALNQLMRSYAVRHQHERRTLLLMAPGWVKTDLGGPNARLTIDESIPNLVETVEAQNGIAGLRYLDYQGNTVSW